MATIKIELFTSKTLADGRHPIYLTVRHNKAVRRKAVGSAFPHEWDKIDKSSNLNAGRIMLLTQSKSKTSLKSTRLSLGSWTDRINPDRQKTFLITRLNKTMVLPHSIRLRKVTLASLEYGSINYDGVKARFDKVKRYAKTDFSINEINDRWIAGFIKHCKTREKNKAGDMGNSKNTINHAFRLIKRVVSFS